MTFLVILAVVLLLIPLIVAVFEKYDRVLVFISIFCFCAIIWIAAALLVDWLYYSRRAFDAVVACEAKRMEPRRLSFTSNVTCVPAYRATKNDTLQVNGIVKP